MNKPVLYLLIFVSLVILQGPLYSEDIYLRNGQLVSGRITGQSLTDITITGLKGRQTIPKREIKKIRYVPYSEEEVKARLARERAARLAAIRRKEELEKQKIEAEKRAEVEKKEKELAELEQQIQADREREAKEQAERAQALRTLVDEGTFENDVEEPISYWDFTWRSLLVPGWGHFYLDRPVVGSLYSGGTVLLIGNAYNQYRIARKAIDANHREVQLNYLMSLMPDLAPRDLRTLYFYKANGKAMTEYKKKVNNFNYSLALLEGFYGLQLIHIIYNGIAWENGLLVVDNDGGPDLYGKGIYPDLRLEPDLNEKGQMVASLKMGIRYAF